MFRNKFLKTMSFIVFEGLDGVGKSTLIKKCTSLLDNCIVTSDPRGTLLSKQLFNDNIGKCTDELDLFVKCRKIIVDQVIVPALNKGLIVLCDRYIESTHAYQGALNISQERIDESNINFPIPNLTFLVVCTESIRKKRLSNSKLDVIETRGEEYFKRVDEIYTKRALEYNYIIIDNTSDDISDAVFQIMSKIVQFNNKTCTQLNC